MPRTQNLSQPRSWPATPSTAAPSSASLRKVTLNLLLTISGPLPAEPHAHHRPVLHIVNAIFPEPAILTKVYGERAITDHQMKWIFEAMDVEAVGPDHLPREVAASAEAADIAFEHKLLVWGNLMPDASSHERVDPFEVARAGDCSRRGALY